MPHDPVELTRQSYRPGRGIDAVEALLIARRATFDPGQFTTRVRYSGDEWETLERWQARAVLVALAATEPDDRWSTRAPHLTEYERDELVRLGLGDWLECSSGYCGWDPVSGDPHTCPAKAPADA